MNVDPEKLREWEAAERFAVLAEEMVRAAVKHHTDGIGPLPSDEIQRIARERRQEADRLFHSLY